MTTPRRRRRAVGPPGAVPAAAEPRAADLEGPDDPGPAGSEDRSDDERLLRERPPHHDRER